MYFGGFCVSEVCNHCLKRIFKQARPERSKNNLTCTDERKIVNWISTH